MNPKNDNESSLRRERLKFEAKRKAFHSGIFFLPFLYWLFGRTLLLILSVFGLFAIAFFEYWRLNHENFYFNRFTREEEKGKIANYVAFFSSVLICIILFEEYVAVAATIMAGTGDALAALGGISLGRHRLPSTQKKTIEGSIFGVSSAFIVGWLLMQFYGDLTLIAVILGSFIILLTDLILSENPRNVFLGDNFWNPLLIAILIWSLTFL